MKTEKLTTEALKQFNREKVYQYIYQQKTTSKQQIVDTLKLGLSTVSQNLTALEAEGRISRDGFFDSTGGRKAQVIQIVPTYRIAIGVGLFKHELQIVAVDLYGQPQYHYIESLPYSEESDYYQKVSKRILEFIQTYAYHPDQILGISIAVQGLVSQDGGRILYGEILKNQGMKLDYFSSLLPYPCRLEHDSKAAARLEVWSHPEMDSAIVFLLNHNLGGAIITGHQIHSGLSMHSGLIEHICIDPNGPLCYCGHKGCLETYCSADALESIAGLPIPDFFRALRTEESRNVQLVWNNYLYNLASAIRNLNMVIDAPVIFSGYLSSYLEEQDLTAMEKIINSSSPFPINKTYLIRGNYGEFAAAIGTALFYTQRFLYQRTKIEQEYVVTEKK